jgi:hypothetical protein
MHCQELNDRLLLLAYDDLDPQERARCEEHLVGCPACREELAALRDTQRLLDLAPERQTQIDLAAVCLRIAARERRSRIFWRWGLGVAGIAASVAAVVCLSSFDVAIEPGRVVVAWQQRAPAPAESAAAPEGQGGGAADSRLAAQEQAAGQHADEPLRASDSDATSFIDSQTALLDWQGGTLATNAFRSRRALPGASWNVIRYAQPATSAAISPARSTTYGELRRKLLESDSGLTTPSARPGA